MFVNCLDTVSVVSAHDEEKNHGEISNSVFKIVLK